jgi:hypothetical protein
MAHAHQIVPRLWLGDRHASMDAAFLRRNNITVVFNCTKDLPFHPGVPTKVRVPVNDDLKAVEINNLGAWAPEIVCKVLGEYKKGRSILIHCFAGMQRSAAVMAMVLLVLTQKTPDDVIEYIRSKRAIAFFPGINFEPSIRRFYAEYHRAKAR